MSNRKYKEAKTNPSALEKVSQFKTLYRRHNKRMDRYLLIREVEFVNQILDDETKPGTLLDLCCGTGEVSPKLDTRDYRSLGLDINLQALTAFRKHSQDVPLIQGDARQLPFCRGSLDVIVAIHCFDIIDRVEFLQDCNRVLRNGGLLIFDALNRNSYKLLLKRFGRFLGPLFPYKLGSKWIDVLNFCEVTQLIDKAGLQFQVASGYGWPPFLVSSNSKLVDRVAFFERFFRLDRHPRVSPRFLVMATKLQDHMIE